MAAVRQIRSPRCVHRLKAAPAKPSCVDCDADDRERGVAFAVSLSHCGSSARWRVGAATGATVYAGAASIGSSFSPTGLSVGAASDLCALSSTSGGMMHLPQGGECLRGALGEVRRARLGGWRCSYVVSRAVLGRARKTSRAM